MNNLGFPSPTVEALAHSKKLLTHVLSQIKAHHGVISFAKYMELALYTPELGYYSTSHPKFGKEGDFITAPEISPLFSQCLARQCQQILQKIPESNILEFGAGTGIMAAHILTELSKMHSLPKNYFIIELSAYLKKQQQETIATICPELLNRVIWLNTLPKFKFNGIILANEVLDAMPICRFQIMEGNMYEIKVCEKNNKLSYCLLENTLPEFLELYRSHHWPPDYISEINLNLTPWISSLSDILETGIILLIDYGFPEKEYYHPQRNMGTLMCHYRHYAHTDPFLYIGLQDITAHVNFTHIAMAANQSKLDILGYTHQAAFLLSCGLMEFLTTAENTEKAKILNNKNFHKLTSPAEMGELFKAIALGRNIEDPLVGFSLIDKRHSL